MFHSSPPCFLLTSIVFFCACLSCVLLYSCIKRSCSFLLQRFSQCVCLSLSVWPSSWLQVGNVRPPSGQPHRVDSWWVKFSPLTPRWPVRRGHTLLPLSPCTLCLCVSLCHQFVFLFTLLQVMMFEVGEISLFPCPPCFDSCLAHDALSSLLVSDSSQCLC